MMAAVLANGVTIIQNAAKEIVLSRVSYRYATADNGFIVAC